MVSYVNPAAFVVPLVTELNPRSWSRWTPRVPVYITSRNVLRVRLYSMPAFQNHRVGNLVVRIHGHGIGQRARNRRGQICLEAQGYGGGRLLRQRARCRKGRLVGHLTRQRIQVGLDVKHAEARANRQLVLPGKPFSGRLPGDAYAGRPVIVMAMKQRRRWARERNLRRHWRNALHLR